MEQHDDRVSGTTQSSVTTRTTYFQKSLMGMTLKVWAILLCVVIAGAAGVLYYQQSHETTTQVAKVIYTCPMHPQIQSPTPGHCPICGMTLVPQNTPASVTTATSSSTDVVRLSNESIVRANVSVQQVTTRDFVTTLNALGVIEIPEAAARTITARARGRIERLYNGTTGSYVKQGAPLYEYYSPDILNAEQEFLVALQGEHEMPHTTSTHVQTTSGLVAAGRSRLALLGLSEQQIVALETKKQITDRIVVLSPASGVIVERLTQDGAYVDEGTAIVQLADLSTVWAEIDVPESNIRSIHMGQQVSIASDAYPGRHFVGRVVLISPIADQSSRSIRVRVALPNPAQMLRPQMTINATFDIDMGNALAVPSSAVVRTGKMDYVWVEDTVNSFSTRAVVLGSLSPDGYYQVTSGLQPGDKVAVTGAFFLDAERQLTANNPGSTMNMSAGDQGSRNSGSGKGTIRAIDVAKQTVTLDHGVIAGVMPAMTMTYRVSDAHLLDQLRTDEPVNFTLTRTDKSDYVITAIGKQ